MIVVRTIAELRDVVRLARARGDRIGLVPTMGALHDGHLSLLARARSHCPCVIVSLFVNPPQFNDAADLERYPRDEARDAAMLESADAHVLFAPTVHEVYPHGFMTTVELSALAAPLEGAVRGTGHFRGVATVVAKLLNMAQPDDAFFGQKDAQQALIITQLVRDLDIPVQVVICPTVREADGLAMSSRNVLLDADSRKRAPTLHRALAAVEQAIVSGERDASRALQHGEHILDQAHIAVDYFVAVSPHTLQPIDRLHGRILVAIAARFGAVRLIDNVLVSVDTPVAAPDGMAA